MRRRCKRTLQSIRALQRNCTPKRGRAQYLGLQISNALDAIHSGYDCEVADVFVKAAYWNARCSKGKRPPGVALGTSSTRQAYRREDIARAFRRQKRRFGDVYGKPGAWYVIDDADRVWTVSSKRRASREERRAYARRTGKVLPIEPFRYTFVFTLAGAR